MFRFFRDRRRRRIREAPFPARWLGFLKSDFPLFGMLPEADRLELLGHTQVFLAEKHFEGCGGLEITDEIRVTIAAQACMLLLHRDTDYYPLLSSVLVYPGEFTAKYSYHSSDGIVEEGYDDRIGETWSRGSVVLSWEDVLDDAAGFDDGFNVTFHEFAHQLDEENGAADGTPLLADAESRQKWAHVMTGAYERLKRDVSRGRPTLIDDYAAEDPAEFFAVLTEAFFEMPAALIREYPEVYGRFMDFYCQDPREYHR